MFRKPDYLAAIVALMLIWLVACCAHAQENDDYKQAYELAVSKEKPIVIFVGVELRKVAGAVAVGLDSYNDNPEPRIIAGKPGKIGKVLAAIASDDEIADAIFPPPVTYDPPWLDSAEQKKIKNMWPEGVEFPATLRFYKLRPASQRVASFNRPGAGNSRMFVSPSYGSQNANRDFPWIRSGGMDLADTGTWRNVTGMALPEDSKIKAWLAPMLVSTQYEWAMHWEFPADTQMFDVLIRKNDDGSEHIFNVRRRVKSGGVWDDGTSFMPDVASADYVTFESFGSSRSRNVLGVPRIYYKASLVKVAGKPKFKETNVAMNDGGHFFPPGFTGTGMTCNKCHGGRVHESQVYGGPLLRGKDTVFSWYPIREGDVGATYTPDFDRRWPIEVVSR